MISRVLNVIKNIIGLNEKEYSNNLHNCHQIRIHKYLEIGE
jgi:hypothetical protein